MRGILVISGDIWAYVGHKIGYARLLVSPSIDTKAVSSFDTKAVSSIDTKAVLSIDVPSNPRQLPLARQKYYSSVKRA